MDEFKELLDKIDIALKRKIFLEEASTKLINYKQKEKEYYLKEIKQLIFKLKERYPQLLNIEEISIFLENPNYQNLLNLKQALSKLEKTFPKKEKNFEEEVTKNFVLPPMPKEIAEEIKHDFSEAKICLENGCYRSTIMLCAKILEIALHRKFFELSGKDLLEKSPDIGLGNLVKKMKEHGYDIDPGLDNQIHLINQLRIYSVHKKPKLFIPSKNQALATFLYTLDILKKLF